MALERIDFFSYFRYYLQKLNRNNEAKRKYLKF